MVLVWVCDGLEYASAECLHWLQTQAAAAEKRVITMYFKPLLGKGGQLKCDDVSSQMLAKKYTLQLDV